MAKKVERTRNAGTWTQAEFDSRIISALRQISQWWKPKQQCLREARVSKGIYVCEQCKRRVPATISGVYKTGNKKGKPRKIKNIVADHINPVVDPNVGRRSWDEYIERMFIETGWQAICKPCHDAKTAEERKTAKKRRENENN